MKGILIFSFLLLTVSCFAQEAGQITVVQDSSIDRVLKMYQTFAKEKRQVNGYRIQLASNNNRQTLMDMKARFIQEFPEVNAYLEYQSPQFKLRVGDYRIRGDADAFVIEARKSFSSAFVVPDKIIVEGVEW